MREERYRLSETDALKQLAGAERYQLATVVDGQPMLRTMLGAVLGRRLVIHSGGGGERQSMIGREVLVNADRVLAEIPSTFLDSRTACPATRFYWSVQASGTARALNDPSEKTAVLAAITAKYQPEGGYLPLEVDSPLYRNVIASLVMVSIDFEQLSGRMNIGQKKTATQIERIINGLWGRGQAGDLTAIELLRETLPEPPNPEFLASVPGSRLRCQLDERHVSSAVALLSGQYWNQGRTTEQLAAVLLPSTAWVGAEDQNGRLIATGRAISDHRRHAMVLDLAVDPDWRHRGLGSRLMQLLLDHPALRNTETVRLATRDGMPFYRRFGFRAWAGGGITPGTTGMLLDRRATPADSARPAPPVA